MGVSDREEFEKAAQSEWPHYSLLTDSTGSYSEVFLQGAWEGWQAARESEPEWTHRLNTCKHHGDDHEACAVYGGRVPCDVESEGGEAVGVVTFDGTVAWFPSARVHAGMEVYSTPQPEKWIPEGWKLVPVEPTEIMMRDAADNLCGQFGVEFVRPKEAFARAVYRELVRFAPTNQSRSQSD